MNTKPYVRKPDSLPADLQLRHGASLTIDEGMCAMQAVAWLGGEIDETGHLSDAPKCACPVVRRFVISVNDRWNQENRQKLLPLIPLLVGSRANRETEIARGYYFADFAVRTLLPWLCDKAGKKELGAKLRALNPVADRATAELARLEARSARDVLRAYADAAADAYAAYAAAYAYAAYAAYAAAYAAYAAAYADAAADAAYAAADAAYAAADAAADAAAKNEIADLCITAIRGALAIRIASAEVEASVEKKELV